MRQQCFHERTSVLYYTYIDGFVHTIHVNKSNKWAVNTNVYRKERQQLRFRLRYWPSPRGKEANEKWRGDITCKMQ